MSFDTMKMRTAPADRPAGPVPLDPGTRHLAAREAWRQTGRELLRVAALLVGDVVGVAAAVAVTLAPAPGDAWAVTGLAIVLSLLGQAALHTYAANPLRRRYDRVLGGVLLSVVAFYCVAELYPSLGFQPANLAVFALCAGAALSGVRFLAERGVRAMYHFDLARRKALIIADGEEAWQILRHIKAAEYHVVSVVGHLALEPKQDPTALGGLELLPKLLREEEIGEVIIASQVQGARFEELVRTCFAHGAAVSIIPAVLTRLSSRVSSRELFGWPVIEMRVPRLELVQVIAKRMTDLAFASLALVALAPVFLLVALAIKLDSRGPVLFRQIRLGMGGRPFRILKFRSMRSDAEAYLRRNPGLHRHYVNNGFKLPPEDDPRVSRLGSFLRRTSLDELPQLFNVLRGEMSLVGPRPIVPEEIVNYGESAPIFLGVKPGLTGYWQINGRSDVGYPERVDYDLHYVTQWSLGLDLRILIRTVPAVFRRDGAY